MKRFSIFIVMMAMLSMTSCNNNGSKANSDYNQEGIGVTTPERNTILLKHSLSISARQLHLHTQR